MGILLTGVESKGPPIRSGVAHSRNTRGEMKKRRARLPRENLALLEKMMSVERRV
jgi:hypothetical protein